MTTSQKVLIEMDWGATPRHYRLRSALIQKIASGQWAAHQAIPSERELEALFAVSRTTIRRALDDLVDTGYVYREQGRGTFVAPVQDSTARAELLGVVEELQHRGIAIRVQVLELQVTPAAEAVAAALNIEAGDPVIYLRRLVTSAGEPMLLVESFVPQRLGGTELYRLFAEEKPVYLALEMLGITIARGQQRLRAIRLDEATAGLLEARAGDPGLELTRLTYSLEGTAIEHSRGVYHGERYQYVIDLTRGSGRRTPPL